MTPTPEQVEELARWLYAAFASEPGVFYPPWGTLGRSAQGHYRHVARALLERPPPVLVDALGLPQPDAVAGG